MMPSISLWILFSTLVILTSALESHQGFCADYVTCMERLEIKQRECLDLDQNARLRSSDSCSRRKWDVKMSLHGLHLRRAELAKDCVRRSIQDAAISESTLDKDMTASCSSLHEKFVFAPGAVSRKKRSSGKRTKRDSKKMTKATECRTAAKAWHKQCSALANCCPLTLDCKIDTKEIMEQIYEERGKLKSLKEQCEGHA